MSTNIILTTGTYDLIKDHIRRKKVNKEQEEILTNELKHAQQVLRKDLSDDIVSVGKKVKVKNHESNQEESYNFVGPDFAKPKKNRHSILSDIGVAIVGYKVGDTISWPSDLGEIKYEILSVENA